MRLTSENIHERLTTLGTEWANANALAEELEELKKPFLSELSAKCEESSAVAKENYALRHPEYKTHVRGMIEARRRANIAKIEYHNAQIWLDWKRTEAANERATMRSAV